MFEKSLKNLEDPND